MFEGKHGRSWRDYAQTQEEAIRLFEMKEEIIDSEESEQDQEED